MMFRTPTVVYRHVGDYVHFLNYTSGEVMSFEAEDGFCLANNLIDLSETNVELDEELVEFLSTSDTQINSRKFRSALVDLGMQFSFPTTVNIELNRRCSLRCKHCYISPDELESDRKEFFDNCSDGQIDDLLNELAIMGIFLMVLTGGEPFLNRNFKHILRAAVDRGIIIEVFSNLQIMPEWFRQIESSELSIGRIQTSVYSVSPTVHDSITGYEGSLSRTINNIEFLKNKGYYVEVATPLMSLNFNDRHETENFFTKMGIPQSFSWPILNEYYSRARGKSKLNISQEQFLQFCREKADFLIKADYSDTNSPICAAARALFAISANGDIFPCSQYPKKVGSLSASALRLSFNLQEMKEIADCRLGDIAHIVYPYNFCMGNNYSETGHPFQQPSFLQEVFAFYEENQKGDKTHEED